METALRIVAGILLIPLYILYLIAFIVLAIVFFAIAIPAVLFGRFEVDEEGNRSIVWKWGKND